MEHNGFAKLIRIPQVHCCEAAERSNVPGRDATNYLKGSGLKSMFILRASQSNSYCLLKMTIKKKLQARAISHSHQQSTVMSDLFVANNNLCHNK